MELIHNIKRLNKIIIVAKIKEQRAAQDLKTIRSQLNLELTNMAHLKNYLKEYTEQFHSHCTQGLSGFALNNFQKFITQLRRLYEDQSMRITLCEKQVENKKDIWMSTYSHIKILSKLEAKYIDKYSSILHKKQQKEQDELTSLMKKQSIIIKPIT